MHIIKTIAPVRHTTHIKRPSCFSFNSFTRFWTYWISLSLAASKSRFVDCILLAVERIILCSCWSIRLFKWSVTSDKWTTTASFVCFSSSGFGLRTLQPALLKWQSKSRWLHVSSRWLRMRDRWQGDLQRVHFTDWYEQPSNKSQSDLGLSFKCSESDPRFPVHQQPFFWWIQYTSKLLRVRSSCLSGIELKGWRHWGHSGLPYEYSPLSIRQEVQNRTPQQSTILGWERTFWQTEHVVCTSFGGLWTNSTA